MSSVSPETLLANLESAIVRLAPQGLLTAYSGGVDSTVVAAAARRVLGRARAVAAIGDSASLPRRELEEARALAAQCDFELIEVAPGEQADPAYLANNPDRCYHCKTHLYAALKPLASARGLRLANGTQADDFNDTRPGLRAAREADVVSPLAEAGLGKEQVRAVAQLLGLPNHDKPAAPCLASRLPHGTPVTLGRLSRVEKAEESLRALGFAGFRVRDHGETGRVEVARADLERAFGLREEIVRALTGAGYKTAALDLAGR